MCEKNETYNSNRENDGQSNLMYYIGLYDDLDEECDKIIEKTIGDDESENFESSGELYNEIVREKLLVFDPKNKTMTEIANCREDCIKALQQDISISGVVNEIEEEIEKIEYLISRISTKPKFEYEVIEGRPKPKSHKMRAYLCLFDQFERNFEHWFSPILILLGLCLSIYISIKVHDFIVDAVNAYAGSHYSTDLNVFIWMVALILPIGFIGGLIKEVFLSIFFTLTFPIVSLFKILRFLCVNSKVRMQNRVIDKENNKAYKSWEENRYNAECAFEREWDERQSFLSLQIKKLNICSIKDNQILTSLKRVRAYINDNVFCCPNDITYEKKINIVECLKNYKATTLSGAMYVLNNEEMTRAYYESRLEEERSHNMRMQEIEENKLREQQIANDEMRRSNEEIENRLEEFKNISKKAQEEREKFERNHQMAYEKQTDELKKLNDSLSSANLQMSDIEWRINNNNGN